MSARAGLAAAVAALALAGRAAAEETAMDAGTLAHALDRLATTARVLYVAAHPDDENTRLLAWLANARHVTAAYLSLTRGGGGQNLIGAEQDALLDVLRTDELLAARRLDGATQRFTRLRDFGYSKRADETLAVWDRTEALADVVWVLRTFQPDVVVTRFDEQPPNHGHHTASAILTREAFAAAADPARFPEQLARGASPWQAERLLLNVPTWREGPPPPDALAVDVGGHDPRLGVGYGELAALSRSQHKSQGFGVAGARGTIVERFVPLAGTRPAADPLDGIELGWRRFGPRAAPLARALDEARRALDRDRPERALPALAAADRALDALPDGDPRVRDARATLARVVTGAAGLFVRATAARPGVVPGGTAAVRVEVVLGRPAALALRRVVFPDGATEVGAALRPGEPRHVEREVGVAPDAPVSAPYWLAERPLPGRYVVRDPGLVGDPSGPPALAVAVELGLGDRVVTLDVPVVHAWTDPVHGERVRGVLIVPPATVTPARQAVMLPNGERAVAVLRVRAGRDDVRGDAVLGLGDGWRAEPPRIPVHLARAGDETTVRFEVTPPRDATPVEVRPAIEVGGTAWSHREDTIDHPHVPLRTVLRPATLRLVPLALRRPAGTIGYVMGSGDTVAADLAHVGFAVEELDDDALRGGDLGRYRAIVVGIRGYNTRAALRSAHERLVRWVEDGGTVVVQYNTNNRVGPLETPIGPHPLALGRGRVTDETAAMVPVDPAAPLLRAPNRIDAADFDGWVQERGLYFAERWDARWTPVFRTADPGEPPLEGGVLVANHGRGRWVYTGLAFFRQLPAGVPGAYRLLVNLLAGPGA
jgi:LmbE family N-acetylglucosaminyl deacetylase